jgi:hypothetical protein
MKSAFKVIIVLLCAAALSACAAAPTHKVEQVVTQSLLDPEVSFERVTLSDNQGASIFVNSRKANQAIIVNTHSKTTTAEQDIRQTVVGTATPSLINVGGALLLQNNAPDCGDNCGGGGTQIVQVQSDNTSGSNSGSSSQSEGCTTCKAFE